jgi:hypothetical protein
VKDDKVCQAVMESAIASGLAPCAPAPAPRFWVLWTFLSQLQRHGYEIKEMGTHVTAQDRAHQLRSLGRLAQGLGFEVMYSARRETEGHNAGHILTGITIETTTKEN